MKILKNQVIQRANKDKTIKRQNRKAGQEKTTKVKVNNQAGQSKFA